MQCPSSCFDATILNLFRDRICGVAVHACTAEWLNIRLSISLWVGPVIQPHCLLPTTLSVLTNIDLQNHSYRQSPQAGFELQPVPHATVGSNVAGYHPIDQQPELSENGVTDLKRSKFSIASLEYWWVLEIVALFLSAVLLAATGVLLQHYDNEPQPVWEMMSLNTLVAWMGTLSRALVLLPVSRSLGQLKWTWFAARSRNLDDVRYFDDASRGVIGSVQLLISRRGWYGNQNS
jgi:hypothetical protein